MRPYWLRFLIQGQINLANCVSYADRIFKAANPQPPTLAFGDDDGALSEVSIDSGGTATISDAPEQPAEVVPGQVFEGEQPITKDDVVDAPREAGTERPDFSKLGGKKPPAEGTPPADETEEQKTARNRDDRGRFAKHQEEKKQQAEASRQKAEEEAAVKAKAPEAKPAADPAKPAEAKKLPTKEEIEKMELPPGASDKTTANFKGLRTIAAEATERVKAAEAKIADYEKQITEFKEKGLDPEKLKEAEDNKRFRELFEAGNHPRFQAEWAAKEQAAETAMIDFLKQYGAKESAIEALKTNGLDSEEGRKLIAKFDAAFASGNFPLERAQLTQLALARRGVSNERQAAIKELETNREGFIAKLREGDKAERDQWVQNAQKAASEFVSPETHPWAHRRAIKGDETPEQKQILEAHNARVDKYETRLKEIVGPLYQKDPAAVMKTVFGALESEVLKEEKAELEAKLATAEARVKELSTHASKVRAAGHIARAGSSGTGADGKPVAPDNDGKIGGDAATAMDRFFNRNK